MKTKAIEAAQERMRQLLTARRKEVEDLEAIMAEENAAITVAENAMAAATDSGDLKAYQAAKLKRADAQDGLEMHSTRLQKLTAETLISEEEYRTMISSIMEELDANTQDTKGRLKAAAEKMGAIGDELQEYGKLANSVMQAVQRDLYLSADRNKDSHGNYLGTPRHSDKFYETVNWAECAMQHYGYQQAGGKR